MSTSRTSSVLSETRTAGRSFVGRESCARRWIFRPAVVIVVELDGPLRLETLASTDGEFRALQEWCRSNPIANHVLAAFYEARDAQNDGFSDRGTAP